MIRYLVFLFAVAWYDASDSARAWWRRMARTKGG
jgi:hypothetical protein